MATTEDRKVFPMTTFQAYLTGEGYDANKQGIKDMLAYLSDMSIDAQSEIFAAAIAKAWIYEQNPELTGIAGHADKFGAHVSVPKLPGAVAAKIKAVAEKAADQSKKIAELNAKVSDLEKKLKDAQAKQKDAEAKVKTLETAAAEPEKKITASAAKVDEYLKKVDDLLAKIEEVKKHGVVTVGAGAPGAPAEAGAAPAGDSAAVDSAGEIADSFGFGTVQEDTSFGF